MNVSALGRKLIMVMGKRTTMLCLKKLPRKFAGRLVPVDTIFVDPQKGDVLAILIHELIHVAYPEKTEKEVLSLENLYIRKASWNQKKIFIRRLIK